MFRMTIQEMIDKFTQDMESGWLRPDDIIGMEYWTYDDVRDIVVDDDDYPALDDDEARAVWADASSRLARYDDVDRDVVRQEIECALPVQEGE